MDHAERRFLPESAASAARWRAGRSADDPDPCRIDAKTACLAADELHAGEHVLHRFGKGLGFGREPIGNGKDRDAARGEIGPPILKRAAHAGDPAAAMDRDQSRRRLGVFRQVEVAKKFDAIVIGIGDAVVDRNAVRHFLISWLEPRAMVKRF
jgi:hypothetical protein